MRASPSILPLSVEGVGWQAGGRWLLRDLSFRLTGGGRTLILGPNGAGKSLTLRLCHGLLTPAAGRVVWQGPGAALPRRVPAHAMVFQKPVLLRRSALANLTHALALAGLDRQSRHSRAEEALDRFGLSPLARRPARVLSGGEQQRLAIARAWAVQPQVIFLDEPTAHLDPASTRAIEGMLDLFKADGVTVVMTTHDLPQARRLADSVIFLHQGRLCEQGPAADFFAQPQTPEAAAYLRGDLLA